MTARTAIVTGAAQGIGEAAAKRLARDGVERFLLIDRQPEKLNAVTLALQADGKDAEALVIDLSDIKALHTALGPKLQTLEAVDILINAAGTTARGGLSDTTPQTFDHIMALNVRAPFFMMPRFRSEVHHRQALFEMRAQARMKKGPGGENFDRRSLR